MKKECTNEECTDSIPVTSGVPQGSVLGPPLFLVFINDVVSCLEDGCEMDIFADDTKFRQSRKNDDNSPLVDTLTNFSKWASDWQLEVAYEKCCVLSSGNLKIAELNYTLAGHDLRNDSEMRDLGILLSADMKFSRHCANITAKANSAAFLIMKCLSSKDPKMLTLAFTSFVRPLLESASPVWSPDLQKDVDLIEKVQKRFTKRVCIRARLHFTNYRSRLLILSLDPLELRRIRFDLCMAYKIIYGLVDLNVSDFFIFKESQHATRGHPFTLRHEDIYKTRNCRKSFFSVRVVEIWNALPDSVVSATSIGSFKSRLEKIDLNKYMKFDLFR